MSSFEDTILAGASKTFPGGDHFHLIGTTAGVDVEFLRNSSPVGAKSYNVESGYWARPEGGFDLVRVTSATTQTVKVLIEKGEAGSLRSVGTVDINSGALDVTPARPTQSRLAGATTNLKTHITPAANIAGVVISSLFIRHQSHHVRVMMDTAAPATQADGTVIAAGEGAGSGSNYNKITEGFCPLPLLVPAGYGVYHQADGAVDTTEVEIAYEIL